MAALTLLGGVAYLLEKSLLELLRSCDGEPAPDRGLPPMMLEEERPPVRPNGGLDGPAEDGSMGELLADGEVDRGWLGGWCEGKPPREKSPAREVDIINYQADAGQIAAPVRLDRWEGGMFMRNVVFDKEEGSKRNNEEPSRWRRSKSLKLPRPR